jgi:parallel beta-helix repeat protein
MVSSLRRRYPPTLLFIPIILMALAMPAGTSHAATFFVAQNGNNSNPGTQSQPWATLEFAADQVGPGDVVLVENGTYAGFQMFTNGTASNPITFRANGNNVVLDRPGSGSDIINIEGADAIIIDGFIVRNAPRVGIRAVECSDVIIQNNDIQFSSLDAILTGYAVRVQILNNICGDSSREHGIYVSNSHGSGDNPIVRGNVSYGNGRSGIQMNGDCFAGGDGDIDNPIIENNIIFGNNAKGISLISAVNYRVANNVIYKNNAGAAGIHCTDEPGCGNPSSGVIVNNTVHETNIACLRITDNSVDNVVFNNIFIGGVFDEVGSSQIDGSSNITSGSLSSLFVNANQDNYHHAAGSPAIDAGRGSFQSESPPTTDMEGSSRPQGGGFDAGAFEFGSGGTTQPPAPPINFNAVQTSPGCVTVSWNPNGEPDLAGYEVSYGNESVEQGAASNYDTSVDVGNVLTFEVCGLSGDMFFAVKAYNTSDLFSGYSIERQVAVQGPDNIQPTVANRSPGNGATGVPVNASVSFSLVDGGTGVDFSTLSVTIDGSVPDNINSTGDPSQYDVVCDFNNDFPSSATIDVVVNVDDFAGNSQTANWSFTTGGGPDATAPIVSNGNPADGSQNVSTTTNVTVEVSDAGAGVDLANVEFYINNVLVPYSWSGNPSSATLTYNNQAGFNPNATIVVRVVVCDLASTPNCAAPYQFSFTTASAPPPPPPNSEDFGTVAPDGYWKDDPTRPLEVRNLPATWTVRIYNTNGQEILAHTNYAGNGTTWSWDFRNKNGERVAGGLYLIRVVDTDGNVRQNGRFVVQ